MEKKIIFCNLRYSPAKTVVEPLVCFFQSNGYRVLYLHANSLIGNAQYNAKVAHKDIKEIGFNELDKLISDDGVRAVICIGNRSIIDKLLVRLAQVNNVKTIYFEHGLHIKSLFENPGKGGYL